MFNNKTGKFRIISLINNIPNSVDPPPPPPPPPRPHIHSSFPLHFTSGPHPTRVHKAASEGKGLIKIGDDITAGSVSQVIRGAVNL